MIVRDPDLLEQRCLAGHLGIGVLDQHLGPSFGRLEIAGDLTRPIMGAGRAAARQLGCRDGKHAAGQHGFELAPQGHFSAPASRAWGSWPCACAQRRPCTLSHISSMPGDSTSLSQSIAGPEASRVTLLAASMLEAWSFTTVTP